MLLKIAESGFESINTKQAIENGVKIKDGVLSVQGKRYELKNFKRIFVLAFGKAALESANALRKIFGEKVYLGFVMDVCIQENFEAGEWKYRHATHPEVSEENMESAKEALEIFSRLTQEDLVICSTSGGGSAIFEVPYKVESGDAAKIFKAMTKGGATISELNTVRKHTSLVKGGQLAKTFFPATVINLLFSDVPGNDISVIASGPLVADPTSSQDAEKLIQKFDVLKEAGLAKISLIETPKEAKFFEKVSNFLIVSPSAALAAMKEKAEELGFEAEIFSQAFQGEARLLGPKIVRQNKKGGCLLGAGESTVKILGKGKGGRNQEMSLAALSEISSGQIFTSLASDGHDNTDAAGAIADSLTLDRAKALGLDMKAYQDNNDSYNFFDKTGDLVITGTTGANVADLFICLRV